jgi:hypothetical protein
LGISLKKARLLELGLAIEQKGVLHPTDKGLRAIVEIARDLEPNFRRLHPRCSRAPTR